MQNSSKYDSLVLKNLVLVNARKKKNLTVREASKLAKINTAQYTDYELLRDFPNEKHKKAICSLYGIPEKKAFPKWMEYLVPGRDTEENEEIFMKAVFIPFSKLEEKMSYLQPITDIQKEAENRVFYEEFIKHLEYLKEKPRHIIEMHIGLNGYKPYSLDEIGESMNISRQRVGQLEKRAWKIVMKKIGQVL